MSEYVRRSRALSRCKWSGGFFGLLRVALAVAWVLCAACPRQKQSAKRTAQSPAQDGARGPVHRKPGEVISGLRLKLRTDLRAPFLRASAPGDDLSLRDARQRPVFTQDVTLSAEGVRVVSTTLDSYLPPNTEIRYHAALRRYALLDPKSRRYWELTPRQLSELLEGGPNILRDDYKMRVSPAVAAEAVAGYPVQRSDAQLNVRWRLNGPRAEVSGRSTISLRVWHCADRRFRRDWTTNLFDFLTLPLQGEAAEASLKRLRQQLGFPLRWALSIRNEGDRGSKLPATLATTVTRVEFVSRLPIDHLIWPPRGYHRATEPYRIEAGGQTATPELLSKIPNVAQTPPRGKGTK